jgi:hypothetical protein
MTEAPRIDTKKVEKLRKQLFDNLVTLEELLAALDGRYTKATVYDWIHREGAPKRKIRGRLFFEPGEFALWMKRSGRK